MRTDKKSHNVTFKSTTAEAVERMALLTSPTVLKTEGKKTTTREKGTTWRVVIVAMHGSLNPIQEARHTQ